MSTTKENIKKLDMNTPPPSGEPPCLPEGRERAILLINIGSPDSPKVGDVKRYLKAFLNDPMVMDMPAFLRKLLVNGIIVPFRAKKSAKRYDQLWTKEGSPLTIHLKNLLKRLSKLLDGKRKVYAGVSYGEPALKDAIEQIKQDGITHLTILPLYPHYAQSTTESAKAEVENLLSDPNIQTHFIEHFYSNAGFIKAVAERAANYELAQYDHILFSYHSLPLKQIEKVKEKQIGDDYDYNVVCHRTSDLLAMELGLKKEVYSTAFQSRFSKRWLAPYTSDILEELVQNNKKKVLVFTPSFVSDCLETSIEIGVEYKENFLKLGGEQLDLVPCVNDSDQWAHAIAKII